MTATPNRLTDAQMAKLARIQNRATLYEAVLVNRTTGAQHLLCYVRNTKRGLQDYITHGGQPRGSNMEKLVRFCGSETYAQPAPGELIAIGDWGMKFSGRTQREAIMAGELPFWKAGL